MARMLEPGRYVATDINSGKVLDLPLGNNQQPYAWGYHGKENQQWDFCPCGAGFIINSVYNSGTFVTVQPGDLKGLHRNGSMQVVTGAFPTCWEVEVLPVRPTDKPGEVFARIRLPYSDGTQMTLGFKENHYGAPLLLANDLCTYWRLRRLAKRSERVIECAPVTISETVIRGDGMAKTVVTNRNVVTTTITRIIPDV